MKVPKNESKNLATRCFSPDCKESKKKIDSVWKEISEKYKIIEKIGSGAFGNVYKAKCKETGQKVAIKHIFDFAENDYNVIKVLREI